MQENINRLPSKYTIFRNATFLWNLVFFFTLLVYAVGLFIPIMEPDAAIYAQVAMEMHDRNDFLSIYLKGNDWLDKPHFPFWMSALSYKLFGVNTFAYKFPAVLFVLLGAYYTFLFARRYYSAMHGWMASIILITAEHIIISNQDVRAEPFMTGLMIMGLYHFSCLVDRGLLHSDQPGRNRNSNRWPHIILGALAAACLIMTKGLFTIIPLAAGIGLTILYQKNWRSLFHWQWVAAAVLMVVFMFPAIYGYYLQFDKHPEKLVFGQNDVSGVEFFLWTSQWGRFTNTGPITGKGDISFFVHTLLWAFLPWAFAAFFALYHKTRMLVRRVNTKETFTYFGFITLFLIFSTSKFQLSFYLNPLFPLLAILTTAVLFDQSRKVWRVFSVMHLVLSILLVVGLIGLHLLFSGGMPHLDTLVIVVCGLMLAGYLFTRKKVWVKKVIYAMALVVLSVNYYLNRDFYPALLKYQAESEAAYYMKENKIPAWDVVFADEMQAVADVILHAPTKVIKVDSLSADKVSGKYVFTGLDGRAVLDSLGLEYEEIRKFEDYPVTRLTGKFINRSTRHLETKEKSLLKVGVK